MLPLLPAATCLTMLRATVRMGKLASVAEVQQVAAQLGALAGLWQLELKVTGTEVGQTCPGKAKHACARGGQTMFVQGV
jgi:hypothetical protein